MRLLIISPAFHGYWRSIDASFAQLGYEVSTWCYDVRTVRQKLAYKAKIELPQNLGIDRGGQLSRSVSERAARVLLEWRPDVVLAVKGDLLGDQFHEAADAIGCRSAVWIYDELKNTIHTKSSIARFAGVASYSRRDTESICAGGKEALFVMDAFDPEIKIPRRHSADIVQIGAKYPVREQALVTLNAAGVPVRTYGRDWSHHPYDVARTWGRRRPRIPAGREMTRGEAMGLMAGAPAALNIHGHHDGFNMRTFEAAGAGAVQIIDRTDLEGVYEPGSEILPYSSLDELVDLSRRAIAEPAWGDRVRQSARRRTLAEHTFVHRARDLERLWL